jgi:hypothetical protein
MNDLHPMTLRDLRRLAVSGRPAAELVEELAPAVLVGLLTQQEARWTFRTSGKGLSIPLARLHAGALLTRDMVVWPLRKSRRALFLRNVITVGRAASNDVVLDDASVSKVHAHLQEQPAWTVTDTGSSNGSGVNAAQLIKGQAHPLKEQDTVVFGSVVLHFFHTPALLELLARPGAPFEG